MLVCLGECFGKECAGGVEKGGLLPVSPQIFTLVLQLSSFSLDRALQHVHCYNLLFGTVCD